MPFRFDRHIGNLEIQSPVRSPEGFLRVQGLAARTGVLIYRQPDGSTRAELVPPEELFEPVSLATLGGKPFLDEHPEDIDGVLQEVTSLTAQALSRGTVSHEVIGDPASGTVLVTVDVHDEDTIKAINGGKVQLSAARAFGHLDYTPGIWDAKSQTYWLGAEALGKPGVPFDAIQRRYTHNHLALVHVGRAGERIKLRLDSADAVSVVPTGGPMGTAKVTLNGVTYDVPEGFAAAFAARLTAETVRFDSIDTALVSAKAEAVRLGAERDAQKILADRAGKIDIHRLVAERLKLERAVSGMRFDAAEAGVDAEGVLQVADMADRDIMVAAIKRVVSDYDPEGRTDEEVKIYFGALEAAGVLKEADEQAPGAPMADDGRDGIQGARQDAAIGNDMARRRTEFANRNDYRNLNTGGQ